MGDKRGTYISPKVMYLLLELVKSPKTVAELCKKLHTTHVRVREIIIYLRTFGFNIQSKQVRGYRDKGDGMRVYYLRC